LPAVVAGALLSVIGSIGLFSVPFVIGTPARIDVLSVYIFRLLDTYPANMTVALALASAMVVLVQGLVLVQRLVLSSGQFATIGGRGFRASRVRLGLWRHPARVLAVAYLAATSV